MKTESKISAYTIRSAALTVVFLVAIVGFASAFYLSEREPGVSWRSAKLVKAATQNRTLTYAERVAYQRAIEDVYWRHRIWPKERPDPKPSLDAVMSQAQLENKVTDYLRDSQAMEDYWQQPITGEQLQAEMDRMAQHTKQSEVLRELFEALGNDPFVIAECLARPVLTERLVADVSAQHQTGRLESLRTAELQMPRKVAAIDSIAEAVQVNRPYHLPAIGSRSGGCIDDTWTATSHHECALC